MARSPWQRTAKEKTPPRTETNRDEDEFEFEFEDDYDSRNEAVQFNLRGLPRRDGPHPPNVA